jgi:hypothetical protein
MHFMLHNFFFFENLVCFSDNVQKYCRAGQAPYDSMANEQYVFDSRATNTHSECVIRAPVLCYTYIAWLVKICHFHLVMPISF